MEILGTHLGMVTRLRQKLDILVVFVLGQIMISIFRVGVGSVNLRKVRSNVLFLIVV